MMSVRGRAALSHYSGKAAVDGDDPYEGGAQPRVSRRISVESKRVLKAEVGAGAIWDLADWFEGQWTNRATSSRN